MNINYINFLIIVGFLLIILEFKNLQINYYYIPFIIILFFLSFFDVWSIYLFNLSTWKFIFLGLIVILFFIILEFLEDKTFDVYCLCALVFLGSIILIISDNLITLYLGLELQTFSTFILIAKNRSSIKSSEAGLKYFMLGAMSSGFYLIGLVVLFLYGYEFDFKNILTLNEDVIVVLSITLILLSFCFKLSLFPLHFWIPDIYEGSSWDIISLIATLPKISIIGITIQLLFNPNIILTFSLFSIVIGTLGALNQTKLKRLLAYSGISHMGFIVLGYTLLSDLGFVVGGFYMIIYMLTMISVFILINNNFKNDFIIELGGLKFFSQILAITLILLILSIAGIPPLSGFISKWYLIWMTIEHQYNISTIIIILFSAIGIGYYLRIVKIIYFQKKGSYFLWKKILNKNEYDNNISLLLLGFIFFVSLFLIINFSFIINIINLVFNFH